MGWIYYPTDIDAFTYQRYVLAAVEGSKAFKCTIIPKMHIMLKQVAWQMMNIKVGLGNRKEDLYDWDQTKKAARYRAVQTDAEF